MDSRRTRGFSLIELLITIVIVSILTTIAVSSYQGSVRKARRGDAKANLLEIAQLLERNFTEANSYSVNIAGNAFVLGDFGLDQSPIDGQAYYNLQFSDGTTTSPNTLSFAIRAVPITGTGQEKDTLCATLTLTETGLKDVAGGATGSAADCWGR